MKKYVALFLVSIIGGFVGSYLFHNREATLASEKPQFTSLEDKNDSPQAQYINQLSASGSPTEFSDDGDFIEASKISTQSVVYIKNISEQTYRMSFMDMFFYDGGDRTAQTISSGSGVIFTSDGYIVSNNHVVEDADKLEVIIGKDTYDAKLIGTDPSTDISVLKIEANNLKAIPLGSSKNLQVGEGVIAVGNPFNLTSTVTSGIVSAKARALNIVKDKFPIESFIQTDAAINPGNSGGALVNRKGELVGINTAILSRTGSYAGYGFAIPVDIVKKVVDDLIKYGEVQKAIMGVEVTDLTQDISKRLDLNVKSLEGVLVTNVNTGFAANQVGIKEEDVLLSIDGTAINSKAEYDELISYRSPGDRVTVKWKSGSKVIEKALTLTNREGTTNIVKKELFTSEYLGADLEEVSKVEQDLYKIDNGVKITKLYSGGLLGKLGLEPGLIITYINDYKIDNPQKLANVLSKVRGRVRIEGVSKSGTKGYYTFYLR
ncbi:MAG: trypsin-like peptidase domain-containing protein [Cyclobacteriaceae bacterium]|nr:trypsin-like peptidase domain-containing protein [Cyclobacteriaceae bacterium]